jgi:hypothetical protein
MTSWVDVKAEFVRDAFCFREIHVLDATQSDWQRMLAALPISPWGWVYKYDEKMAALPTSFSASLQDQGSPYLVIDEERLRLRCIFLEEDDLEFFFDVASVQDEPAFERLLEFMRWLCKVLGKPVALFYETPALPFSDAILHVTPGD